MTLEDFIIASTPQVGSCTIYYKDFLLEFLRFLDVPSLRSMSFPIKGVAVWHIHLQIGSTVVFAVFK